MGVAAPASATPCPDMEVVFARGTFEAPGVGPVGQSFVDSLRAKSPGKSVEVYPVNYPASLDFATAADGVIDASNKVRATAAACPDTNIVVGGFSQGAAVAAYITADRMPEGYAPPPGMTGPMEPSIADHVAAVTLFGKPSSGFLQRIYTGAPEINVGPSYAGKTLDLCIETDPICSPTGGDGGAHGAYALNGMTNQAADFVVSKLARPDEAVDRATGSQVSDMTPPSADSEVPIG
ncbi:cutinase family protein [Mycobacterium sp. CPCC 205710]|uniref:Cutinase family protein n=2 Tax=Mycobacterium deserti TaxID=2978347 RepID=A0ABT2MGP0_9MYCO|nr:cutinase family protein [Mycobacterium deserti]MCT7661387.1 cutinase family protein [Mycobacterium deserti]